MTLEEALRAKAQGDATFAFAACAREDVQYSAHFWSGYYESDAKLRLCHLHLWTEALSRLYVSAFLEAWNGQASPVDQPTIAMERITS